MALGRGYFRPQAVRQLVTEHMSGRRAHSQLIGKLVAFELWHRRFVDR